MFVAGDLEGDAGLIEKIITVMEAARVGACPSRPPGETPIRFGTIDLTGPRSQVPNLLEELE